MVFKSCKKTIYLYILFMHYKILVYYQRIYISKIKSVYVKRIFFLLLYLHLNFFYTLYKKTYYIHINIYIFIYKFFLGGA